MKILWINGSPLPDFAYYLGLKEGGGLWLVRLSKVISEAVQENNQLIVICAVPKKSMEKKVKIGKICYIGIYSRNKAHSYSKEFSKKVKEVIQDNTPDIIHIWGTENEFSYCSFKAAEEIGYKKKTIVSLQGIVSIIAIHYFTGIPIKYVMNFTLSEIAKRKNIYFQAKEFSRRGIYEQYVIKNCPNIVGRTLWDKAYALELNRQCNYYISNETLRDSFYGPKWDIDKCERHSIFMSSSGYPVKGVHMMIKALRIVKQVYPDVQLYVPGKNRITSKASERLRFNSYDRYIYRLIDEYELQENITFLGYLSEKEMLKRYLNANVFVSASLIENSSNAIGEAMILGVPVVASCVGGIQSLLEHGREGLLYSVDEPHMLARYVLDIFENDCKALRLSEEGRKRALITHSLDKNFSELMKVYMSVIEKASD